MAKKRITHRRGLRNRAKPEKKEYARQMRANPTESERILWRRLRARRCDGFKFRRQAIILGWIADFYCPAARLVVEVDGSSHRGRVREDKERDTIMKNAGLTVLRIPAELVVKDPDAAIGQIRSSLKRTGRPPR